MTAPIRKLSFQEAWDTLTVFFVDEELESEIDQRVTAMMEIAERYGIAENGTLVSTKLVEFLTQESEGLDFLLYEIGLSEEKFLRIISLLRRIGRIPSTFDSEWSLRKIKRKLATEHEFAELVASLILDGKRDKQLAQYIPRYYLETLNLRELTGDTKEARRVRYKRLMIGTYSGRKGYKVENLIEQRLISFNSKYGIGFEKGRSRFIDTDIDFAIPSLESPWVVLMSSFQETTSSGQSTKARDMLSAYERLRRSNIRYGEKRIFINFVDGGGWLARKRDFERLVENCDYFLNLYHLDMPEGILAQHLHEL
ncbi:MAG: hypothetical protein ACOY16_03925 [Chloroflexota bacterium]